MGAILATPAPKAKEPSRLTPSLTTIPTELLLEIWRNLDARNEKLALVKTSRRLLHTFAPLLYRENVVNGQSSGLFWAAATGNVATLKLFASSAPEFDINAVRNPPPPHLQFEKMRQTAREDKLQAWQDLGNELGFGHADAIHQTSQYYRLRSNGYCTALHLAAKNGHISAVQWLIDNGADPNGPGRHVCDCRLWGLPDNVPPLQYTPLHTALCYERQDIAILLLQNGASARVSDHLDPFFPTFNPAVPAPNAADEYRPVTALMTAAEHGLLSGPLMSLLTEGDRHMDIQATDLTRNTAFHYEATCLRDASLIRQAKAFAVPLTPWFVSSVIMRAIGVGNFVAALEMFNNAAPGVSDKLSTRIQFGLDDVISWVHVCCFPSGEPAKYFAKPWRWTADQDSEEIVDPAKWIDLKERQKAARKAFLAAILDVGYNADTGLQPGVQGQITAKHSPLWYAVAPELGPEYVKLLLDHDANVTDPTKSGPVLERAVAFWKNDRRHGDDEEETVRLLLTAGVSAEAEIDAWLDAYARLGGHWENDLDDPIRILDMILRHATVSNVTAVSSHNTYEQQALWCLLHGHYEPCTLFVQHQHVRFRFLTDEERHAHGGRKSIKAYTATDEERTTEVEFNAIDHVLHFLPWSRAKRELRRNEGHSGEEKIHAYDFGNNGLVLTTGYDSEDVSEYGEDEDGHGETFSDNPNDDDEEEEGGFPFYEADEDDEEGDDE